MTQEIALVLPPLLTIMDDWDTQYRLQGLECLDVLLDKVAPVTMKRMGIDQLFLKVNLVFSKTYMLQKVFTLTSVNGSCVSPFNTLFLSTPRHQAPQCSNQLSQVCSDYST